MHSPKAIGRAWKDLRQYAKDDWRYVLGSSVAILALFAVSMILLPTRRDPAGHVLTPAGLRFLSFVTEVVGACIFFTLPLRSYAWIMKRQLEVCAILKSLVSYIGPIITLLICTVLLYLAVPLIILTISTSGVADRAGRVHLFSVAIALYVGVVLFFTMYCLPILILERQTGFMNLLIALKQSTKEVVPTLVLALPAYVLGLIQLLIVQTSPIGVGARILHAVLSEFVALLAFYLYVSFTNPQNHQVRKEL